MFLFSLSLPPVSFNLKRTKQKQVPTIAVAEALLERKIKMSPCRKKTQWLSLLSEAPPGHGGHVLPRDLRGSILS